LYFEGDFSIHYHSADEKGVPALPGLSIEELYLGFFFSGISKKKFSFFPGDLKREVKELLARYF